MVTFRSAGVVVWLVGLNGCFLDTGLPADTVLQCERDEQCPNQWSCDPARRVCVDPDSAIVDTDEDGVLDAFDVCPGGNDLIDTDGDGVPNACDVCLAGDDNVDADTDEVPDACDICPGGDDRVDADMDGVPADCDPCDAGPNIDSDADSVIDGCDLCPGFDDSDDDDGDGIPLGCDLCPGVDNTSPDLTDPEDDPAATPRDANCDGVDGEADRAFFVSVAGDNGNDGISPTSPFASIQAGIDAAAATLDTPSPDDDRDRVYVSTGAYSGPTLTFDPRVSVFALYDFNFRTRRPGNTSWYTSTDRIGARATGVVDGDIVVDGLTISAAPAPSEGESSIGFVTEDLSGTGTYALRRLELRPGRGGPGAAGARGATGEIGADGNDSELRNPGLATAPSTCANGLLQGEGGDGGMGGDEGLNVTDGDPGMNGQSGGAGSPPPGIGGLQGFSLGVDRDGKPGFSSSGFATGGTNAAAIDATDQAEGVADPDVPDWSAGSGARGMAGANGSGGGGGGGGGGNGGAAGPGVGGSSGGNGGCGGEAGMSGEGGGGSIGVFVVNAPVLSVDNSQLILSPGGAGGRGGEGGDGGFGGFPGQPDNDTFANHNGDGGTGGFGSAGGRGGGGQGGAGGGAIGILCAVGDSACQSFGSGSNTVQFPMAAAPGGAGGTNGSTSAPAGADGLLVEVLVLPNATIDAQCEVNSGSGTVDVAINGTSFCSATGAAPALAADMGKVSCIPGATVTLSATCTATDCRVFANTLTGFDCPLFTAPGFLSGGFGGAGGFSTTASIDCTCQ